MKYLITFLLIFGGTAITQFINFYATKNQVSDFQSVIKFTLLMSIPILLSNILYMMYFGYGSKLMSYLALSVAAFFVAITFGFVIQGFLLGKQIQIYEILGIFIVFVGLLTINKDKVLAVFNS